jgi:MFS family permease
MGVIDAYRRVFRNGPLTRLLLSEFVSSIGDWLYLVALLVVVWDVSNGDPLVLGIVGAARILPYILLSIPAGIVADRYDRRLVLLTADAVRAVLMVAIAGVVLAGLPVILVVVLSVIATCFSAFFSPAIGAYLPALVKDESELGPANSAWSSLDNLAFFIGPAFAAFLLAIGSLAGAFLLNALTFAFVALVLWRLPPGRPTKVAPTATDEHGLDIQPTRARAREIYRPILKPLSGLALMNISTGFVFGGLGVLTVVLAVDVYKVGEPGTGLLNSAIGVGGVVGALVAGALVLRRRLGPPLVVGAILMMVGLIVLGQSQAFVLALVAIALAAGASLLLEIISTTLLQRIVPDAIRGRTIGIMETTVAVAYSAGSFVLPVFGASQPVLVLTVSGVIILVSGIVSVVLLGKYAVQEPTIAPAAGRIADVGLFAGLPPARLEQAMRAAIVRDVPANQVIIRQGDEADFFYVIDSGRVEVTQVPPGGGQTRVLREMGTSEVFGEIGLLTGVPRTATVTAVTDVRVAALPKQAFLELVSEGPGLTYRLLDLHRGGIQQAEAQ